MWFVGALKLMGWFSPTSKSTLILLGLGLELELLLQHRVSQTTKINILGVIGLGVGILTALV